MKRKIKKIIAGILFASMLTGNVSMNVVYGTENYGDRIEENQSANIEDGGKQFTEEDNTQNQNQNKTEDGLNEDQSSVNTDATEGTEQEVESGKIGITYGKVNFVYIESPYVQTPGTQRIVFSFDKEITGAETIALMIEDEEGNQEEWNLAKQSGTLYLFEKEYAQGVSAGIYKATNLLIKSSAEEKKIALDDIGVKAEFGVDTEYEGIEELKPVEGQFSEEESSVETSVVTIDENGDIITEIQKAGIKPKILNTQVTLENGNNVEDNSQVAGTKLKITFDTSIEGGEIIEVTPGTLLENNKVEYTTDGNEKIVTFTVKGKINEQTYSKKAKVSVENKYIISKDSLMQAIEEINTSSANRPIQIKGKDGETKVYNTDTIVYDGNLTFDGTEKNINNISLSETTYSIGDAANDAGTSSADAKRMVVLKIKGDLTIDSGVTVTACANSSGYGGPKGLFIYCTGTLTNNGTIDMTARGAKGAGENVYLYKNSDNTYEYIPAIGAEGGERVIATSRNGSTSGKTGKNGVLRQTRRRRFRWCRRSKWV